jgi:hypothetical protein
MRVKKPRNTDRHSPGYMAKYMKDWQRRKRAQKKIAESSSKPVDTSV